MLNRIITFLFLAAVLVFVACNDDDNTTETGNIQLAFKHLVNGQAFTTGQTYDIGGTAVSFDLIKYYVGGINVIPAEGNTLSDANTYILAENSVASSTLGSVNTGRLQSVNFYIGVEDAINTQTEDDFTMRDPVTDPLGMKVPAMHWNWMSGYKFIRIDGMVDTDGDGTPETGMQFHTGSSDFFKNMELATTKNISTGTNQIVVVLDIEKLFNNIDLSTEYLTHVGDDRPLADKFQANLDAAFSIE